MYVLKNFKPRKTTIFSTFFISNNEGSLDAYSPFNVKYI